MSLLTTAIATYCDAPFLPSFDLASTWPSTKIGNAHKGENAITFEKRPQLKIGRLVIDPFSGSSSTGVAALLLGQDYVGFDTDTSVFTPAATRLKAVRDAITSNGQRAYHKGLRVALARSNDTEESLKKKLGRFTAAFKHLRDPDAQEEEEEQEEDSQNVTRNRNPTRGAAGSSMIDDQAEHSGDGEDDEGDDADASDVGSDGNIRGLVAKGNARPAHSGPPPQSVHPPESDFARAAKKAAKKRARANKKMLGDSKSGSSSSGSSSSGSGSSSSGSSSSSSKAKPKPRQVIPSTQETVVKGKQAAIKRQSSAGSSPKPTPNKKPRQEQETVPAGVHAARKRLALSSKNEALEVLSRRRSERAGNK